MGSSLLLLAVLLPTVMGYIRELTDADFDTTLMNMDSVMVEFYAPWCSDCQKLAPELDYATALLGDKADHLVQVDCFGYGKGICTRYGVKSWPQLKLFDRGVRVEDYAGAQTGHAITDHIRSRLQPTAPYYFSPTYQYQPMYQPLQPRTPSWSIPMRNTMFLGSQRVFAVNPAASPSLANLDIPRSAIPSQDAKNSINDRRRKHAEKNSKN